PCGCQLIPARPGGFLVRRVKRLAPWPTRPAACGAERSDMNQLTKGACHAYGLDIRHLPGAEYRPDGRSGPDALQEWPRVSGRRFSRKLRIGRFRESPPRRRLLPDQPRLYQPGAEIWRAGAERAGSDGVLELEAWHRRSGPW